MFFYRDIVNSNSFVAGSINIFGSMCVEQGEKGNKRALDLCSIRLKEWSDKLSNNDKEILKPFINFIYAASKNKKVPVLPAIQINENDWNNKSANNFMSNYLGAGHVIDDKIEKYQNNSKEMNKKYDEKWKKNGKTGKYMGNGHIPTAKVMSYI